MSTEFNCTITFVYAAIAQARRMLPWDDLCTAAQNITGPWIVVDDFNVISSWAEKKGGARRDNGAMAEFNEFQMHAGLSDAGFSNNRTEEHQIWMRLDRVLINGFALALLPDLRVEHLAKVASDHTPLLIKCGGSTRKPAAFKYLRAWHSHAEFLSVVEDEWPKHSHANPILAFALKLKVLADKAKAQWVADGDRNTTLFHAMIKARRAKNRARIETPEGTFIEDRMAIGSLAHVHFKGVLGDDDNDRLTAIPDEEEIHQVIKNLNPASAPCPDGFTGHFYHHCWQIIKMDLVRAIRAFFLGTPLPSSISSTNLVLIPKKPTIERIDQLRPISFCNFIHKIISSILNSRLRPVLPRIISQGQCGFIPGRSMMDSIALAHDLTCHINNGHRGGNIIMKIDMSKAYDRVSWLFLIRTPKAMGFSDRWCDLIFRNISNCYYSVLWDGSSFGHFKSNQGVRQGDPLSPSLFVICMEVFSRMIHHGGRSGRIEPFFTKTGVVQISHLLYADDMLIFTNGLKHSLERLLAIINLYCANSGQQLNPLKSTIFFDDHIPEERRRSILRITGFAAGAFPTIYLGAPLFPGRVKIIHFQGIEDKIRTRIGGWIGNLLSMGGKIIIIESILNSLLTHILAALPTPVTVINRISSLFASFLWDNNGQKRRHWVNWTDICRPHEAGGLGIRNLNNVRKALHYKMAWRCMQSTELWGRLKWLPLHNALDDLTYRQMLLDVLPDHGKHDLRHINTSNLTDQLVWERSTDGAFSTKAFTLCVNSPKALNPKLNMVWHRWLPPRISVFLWRLYQRALATDDTILSCGLSLASKCRCCAHPASESLQHLFVQSDLASQIWSRGSTTWNIQRAWTLPHIWRAWFSKTSAKPSWTPFRSFGRAVDSGKSGSCETKFSMTGLLTASSLKSSTGSKLSPRKFTCHTLPPLATTSLSSPYRSLSLTALAPNGKPGRQVLTASPSIWLMSIRPLVLMEPSSSGII
ncbi:hypothetical protein QQ045_014873 [Rhodiola kirilowii]